MSCIPGASCAQGHGTCDVNTSMCICDDAMYADQSDFVRSTSCAVYKPVFQALWGLNAVEWIFTDIISVIAFLTAKRRTKELITFEKRHALVCLASSLCATVLSFLQLWSNKQSGAIAIDPATSVFSFLSQMLCWTALVVKPSTKSETSIARFAMEQNQFIKTLYVVVAPIFMIVMGAASTLIVVGSASTVDEGIIGCAYFYLDSAGFFLVGLHIFISMFSAKRIFDRALAKSVIVNNRTSVKLRMEKFVSKAKKVMVASLTATLLLAALSFSLGVCPECRRTTVYIIMPIMMLLCGMWIFRAMFISSLASMYNRKQADRTLAHAAQHAEDVRSSGERHTGMSPQQKVSKRDKVSKERHPEKKHKMTVVVEADYEGSLAKSQMESFGGLPSPRAQNQHVPLMSVHEEGATSSDTDTAKITSSSM